MQTASSSANESSPAVRWRRLNWAVEQHREVFGYAPPTLLLDGGFASNALWAVLVEQGIRRAVSHRTHRQ